MSLHPTARALRDIQSEIVNATHEHSAIERRLITLRGAVDTIVQPALDAAREGRPATEVEFPWLVDQVDQLFSHGEGPEQRTYRVAIAGPPLSGGMVVERAFIEPFTVLPCNRPGVPAGAVPIGSNPSAGHAFLLQIKGPATVLPEDGVP